MIDTSDYTAAHGHVPADAPSESGRAEQWFFVPFGPDGPGSIRDAVELTGTWAEVCAALPSGDWAVICRRLAP